MEIKKYSVLPPEARALREQVFIDEQKFSVEFDALDDSAAHLVMYDGDTAAAVCRFFFCTDNHRWMIGRVAVAKEYRGRNLGSQIMEAAEDYIRREGGTEVELSAQCRVRGFYESLGYEQCSGEYLDEYCPHILMKKAL